MCWKQIATFTDEILNRFQAEARLRELEIQSQPQQHDGERKREQDDKADDREQAINQRLRDFAAFERRAKGNDV